MMEKQLIVAVEGTAAVGPFWQTIISDYLDKMIRSFTKLEPIEKKPSAGNWQLAMVVFTVHGSHGACLVRRSGWTTDIDMFFQWLSAIPFSGGGFNDAAVAESLAEALTMFSSLNGSQTQQNVDGQRHCILIAASNPYPLPTPVYHPHMQNVEQSGNIEAHTANRLSDAETVAKEFPQCSVSLSVICPKQLPKLRAIYNAGKRDPQAADPPIDTSKNPNFLVLISENFIEACAAFNRTGMEISALNQILVEMDMSSVAPVSAPAATFDPAVMSQQPISAGSIPSATVNMEPTTVTSVTGPALPHIPTARPTSQLVASLQSASPISVSEEVVPNNEIVNETKPILSGMTQPLRSFSGAAANARILNDVAQAQALVGGTSIGLQSMGGTPILSNMIPGGISSSIPAAPTVLSSGQLAVTSMSGLVPLAGTGQIAQNSVSASSVSIAPSMSGNSNLCVSQLLSNIQGGVSAVMHQNVLSGTGAGMPFGTGTLMSTPRMTQPGHPGMQPLGRNNSTEANIPLSQRQTSATLSSAQSNYVKVWEGDLSGQRQGEPVLITRLQGFRIASASKSLAADWPQTMQIVRLITQEHLNNDVRRLIGKSEIVVFWAMDQHVFLSQLQEKKFCAVIQLPSQAMILSVSDKTCRLIGMLFPENTVVFKPQKLNQQLEAQHPQLEQLLLQQSLPLLQQQRALSRLQQQQPLQQLQQQQHLMPLKRKRNIPLQQQPKIPKLHRQQSPQIQQQQQIPQMQQTEQQQPIIGTCVNQASTGGPRRAQLMSQGQASSRGLPNVP
ncbi:mediator of RNA polymerase II transcription subunit 25 isoform X2 [Nicotiana tabacum]|uniref:Mediator of RNA polymerase II transcription subunit 25 isoform X2 n=3 Tax=Nicotiana tabacum TaxID=4097 RepID=A0AC58TJN6_TOBAC|nr:PREDICTED: mediator of RNA polymerase II transcription subunit 25-like isoform X2 [Nicotiana tabacum]